MRHANHVVLPTIIDAPGKYITRGGEVVVIDRFANFRVSFSVTPKWAHGRYGDGTEESWDISGRLYPNQLSDNDIVAKAE